MESGFPPPPTLRSTLASIAALLKQKKETVAVVETAAGGLISAYLLSTPGASAYYRGGLTLYTLESRITFAGWTEQTIKDYAGPTPEIVADLAQRIRLQLSPTYVICESGIAGPTVSKSSAKPPGYVALAVAGPDASTTQQFEVFTGSSDREHNMLAFAEAALKFLLQVLRGDSVELGEVVE